MKLASLMIVAAALALAPGIASAAQNNMHHKRVVRTAQPEHIACTKAGCFPVAANCTPHTQLNWRGNPTGYDAISCQ